MGEDAISNVFRDKLEQDLNGYQTTMSQTLDSFNQWMNHYSHRMQESLNGVQYFALNDFTNVNQNIRNEAISQVCRLIFATTIRNTFFNRKSSTKFEQFQSHPGDDGLKSKLQQKMEQKFNEIFPNFENQNIAKRHSFRVIFCVWWTMFAWSLL